jgi:hypothetical protein
MIDIWMFVSAEKNVAEQGIARKLEVSYGQINRKQTFF